MSADPLQTAQLGDLVAAEHAICSDHIEEWRDRWDMLETERDTR